MAKQIEKLLNEVKHMTFPDDAKQQMRHMLNMYADSHPVRGHVENRLPVQGGGYTFFGRFISINTLQNMTLALIIAMIIGGSTSYAAEAAVPGDLLYPVKVNVNENVRGALAVTDESQADWDTRVAERRVEEAVVLASRGDITTENDAVLKEDFEKHSEKANSLIAKIEEEGDIEKAIEARSEFEARLRAQQNVLMGVVSGKEDIRAKTDGLIDSLRTRIEDTTEIRSQIGIAINADERVSIDMEQAARNKKESVANKIEEVEKYVENKKDKVSDKTYNQARVKVKVAKELFATAETELKAQNYTDAFKTFTEAHILVQEAKIYMATSVRFVKDEEDDQNTTQDDQGDTEQHDEDGQHSLEIEADVYTDVTVVNIEKDDSKSTFETEAKTRAEIVTAIAKAYDLTESEVDAALKLETKDQSSHGESDEDINDHENEDEDNDTDTSDNGHDIEVDSRIEVQL